MATALALAGTVTSTTTYTFQPSNTVPSPSPIQQVYSVEYLKGIVGEESIKSRLDKDDYTEIMATINCESGFQVDPPHNGISWGIGQFTRDTWYDFGTGDIMNPINQIKVMVSMWKNYKNRWDCYRLGLYKQYEP